jgi:hypothetical protein
VETVNNEEFESQVQTLRLEELAASYRQAAIDRRLDPDAILDFGITDGLEPSDGSQWLERE